jgi:hypothetical protein
VRPDDELGRAAIAAAVAYLDPHFARRHAAQPGLVRLGLEPQDAACRDGVDAEGDVVADGDGLRGGQVGFREGDC